MASNQEINVFDPIEFFPPEITVRIFKFLKPTELLLASEVSTLWYDFIGGSRVCMDKIKVNIKCSDEHDVCFKCISPVISSTRKYQHLNIQICSFCTKPTLEAVRAHVGKWRTVRITESNFKSPTEILDIFESIEPSVEKLFMSKVFTIRAYTDGSLRSFNFPKLKVLQTEFIQVILYSEAFNNLKTLEEFSLSSNTQTIYSLGTIVRLLQTNVNLKHLKIACNVFNQIMYNIPVEDCNFKLETLSINAFHIPSSFSDRIQENFIKLLTKQSNTLIKLEYEDWMGIESTKAAFNMPNLKELTLKGIWRAIDVVDWDFESIPVNKSINRLILHVGNSHTIFHKMMQAAPNVTCFKLPYIDHSMLTSLAKSHPNMICLSGGTFNVASINDKKMFSKLKNFVFLQYKSELERSIRSKRRTRRSHFEKKIRSLF